MPLICQWTSRYLVLKVWNKSINYYKTRSLSVFENKVDWSSSSLVKSPAVAIFMIISSPLNFLFLHFFRCEGRPSWCSTLSCSWCFISISDNASGLTKETRLFSSSVFPVLSGICGSGIYGGTNEDAFSRFPSYLSSCCCAFAGLEFPKSVLSVLLVVEKGIGCVSYRLSSENGSISSSI